MVIGSMGQLRKVVTPLIGKIIIVIGSIKILFTPSGFAGVPISSM